MRFEIFERCKEMLGATFNSYSVTNPPFHYSKLDDLDLQNINFSRIEKDSNKNVIVFANATQRSLQKMQSLDVSWKAIRVIRDPRQVLISNYFHHKSGHATEINGWVWDKLIRG